VAPLDAFNDRSILPGRYLLLFIGQDGRTLRQSKTVPPRNIGRDKTPRLLPGLCACKSGEH
jgi:hypothetical protein